MFSHIKLTWIISPPFMETEGLLSYS